MQQESVAYLHTLALHSTQLVPVLCKINVPLVAVVERHYLCLWPLCPHTLPALAAYTA